MVMRGSEAKSNGSAGRATARVAGFTMRCSVSPITAGCSCSSFSMKWRKLPLPIAEPVRRVSFTSRCTSAPSGPKKRALWRSTTVQSPSFR